MSDSDENIVDGKNSQENQKLKSDIVVDTVFNASLGAATGTVAGVILGSFTGGILTPLIVTSVGGLFGWGIPKIQQWIKESEIDK